MSKPANEMILVLDFGGQYNQLIARRVRDNNVFAEILPYTAGLDEIRAGGYKGVIFTGGPNSVYDMASPHYTADILDLGVPILGICYGCQLMAHLLGGEVTPAQDDTAREYGKTRTCFDTSCRLFQGLPEESVTWMSHGDYMARVPARFTLAAFVSLLGLSTMTSVRDSRTCPAFRVGQCSAGNGSAP